MRQIKGGGKGKAAHKSHSPKKGTAPCIDSKPICVHAIDTKGKGRKSVAKA